MNNLDPVLRWAREANEKAAMATPDWKCDVGGSDDGRFEWAAGPWHDTIVEPGNTAYADSEHITHCDPTTIALVADVVEVACRMTARMPEQDDLVDALAALAAHLEAR